jgi:hypothetical protein
MYPSYQNQIKPVMKQKVCMVISLPLKGILAVLCILLLNTPVSKLTAQETVEKKTVVYPSFGLGIGFFYPKDVNDYIQNEFDQLGYTEQVNTSMYMFMEVHGGITFRMKRVDITGSLEYDFAPKLVVVTGGGSNITYVYSRISPLVTANYYIPVKSGKHAFFIGGGVNYSFMKFKNFSASNPGLKLQAGFSMQLGKFNMQPYAAFNMVKATDSSHPEWGDFELSYTGGQIGIILSFHKRMLFN